MIYGMSDTKTISKEKIDETFSDLGLEEGKDERKPENFEESSFHLDSLSEGSLLSRGSGLKLKRIMTIRKGPRKTSRRLKPDKLDYTCSTDKNKLSVEGPEKAKGVAGPGKSESAFLDSIYSVEKADQLLSAEFAEILEVEEKGIKIGAGIRAASAKVQPERFRLDTQMQNDIEDIVKERWRYLVMQFGGVFLTEVRPNRCFIGNKSLADILITYDEKQGYGINKTLLGNYLNAHSNGKKGKVQVHFSDIMWDPRIKDYNLFSITSGDMKKTGIFLDLAKFLGGYNRGEETVIPVHLPYYEKWKTEKIVREFGKLDANGERAALKKADDVLEYLEGKFEKGVKLALETGNGESERNGEIAYGLLYQPFHFQTLVRGRENFVSLCEDVGHLNLESAETNWKDYLTEAIAEFHVSGNNGRQDEHIIATPKTLKNYNEIMSFLKFYAGNICAEVGKGKLSGEEFVKGVKNFAYVLFSEPVKQDFENLRKIEKYVKVTCGGEVNKSNLNEQRYGAYRKYLATQASS